MYYLYVASSPYFRKRGLLKIGVTQDPKARLQVYLTGNPPVKLVDKKTNKRDHDMQFLALWKTDAVSRSDMYDCEEDVHNEFYYCRLMRNRPRDTEWFHFERNDADPLLTVSRYIDDQPWAVERLQEEDIKNLVREDLEKSHLMTTHYAPNRHFIKKLSDRHIAINEIQKPVINGVVKFLDNPGKEAGIVIGPCGIGKTRIAVTSIGRIETKRVIVCCPFNSIQTQWMNDFLNLGVFNKEEILIVGSAAHHRDDSLQVTTDSDIAKRWCSSRDTYCIITTYASSNILMDCLDNTTLMVLDEAHHMAGETTTDQAGIGSTRNLLVGAVQRKVKRLSLTFTPRYIKKKKDQPPPEKERSYYSMENEAVFGAVLAQLYLRDMITRGVLPDYRIWVLRDDRETEDAKLKCILRAWQSTEVRRGEIAHLLNHMVVFCRTHDEAKSASEFFQKHCSGDTEVVKVLGGDNVDDIRERFTSAKRAILVNCFVLGEGVDLPVTDSVAITYPKQSQGQTTQMILRAGRWSEGKSIFHLLLPVATNDDMSGVATTLGSLASVDSGIRDEVMLRLVPNIKNAQKKASAAQHTDEGETIAAVGNKQHEPSRVIIDSFESTDIESLVKCLNATRQMILSKAYDDTRDFCIKNKIDNSEMYYTRWMDDLRDIGLPEDPTEGKMCWFDYLHPEFGKVDKDDFKKKVFEQHEIQTADEYKELYSKMTDEERTKWPSELYIQDGYFGKDAASIQNLTGAEVVEEDDPSRR